MVVKIGVPPSLRARRRMRNRPLGLTEHQIVEGQIGEPFKRQSLRQRPGTPQFITRLIQPVRRKKDPSEHGPQLRVLWVAGDREASHRQRHIIVSQVKLHKRLERERPGIVRVQRQRFGERALRPAFQCNLRDEFGPT